ncbi:MAG: ABC transporter substrate-binding protein [Bacteroidales bacterium]
MKKYPGLVLLALLCSCHPRPGDNGSAAIRVGKTIPNAYARGFGVREENGYRILEVHDPWQNSRNVTMTYLLAEDPGLVPDSLRGLPVIPVPVDRVITLSTTHVAMIERLEMGASIKGTSGTDLIYSPAMRERIDAGEIMDVGYDQGLNYEVIVDLHPDVLFMYGVETDMRATSDKLADLGIPVVYCAEYLEPHPLGKAEWIRFFALFYQLEQRADTIFTSIDSNYTALTGLTGEADRRPRVLTGLPWKDTWYMAGGKSFAARLIQDAGGDYLWSDDPSEQAIPLDLESVYSRALEADVWINPGVAASLDQLAGFDERFTDLPVFRKGAIYNNDRRIGPGGGNDYWESGTVCPDVILEDLIRVFHPDLLKDHPLKYYRKLQ